jgi:E3 ubiquitin-protein ligase DOA10
LENIPAHNECLLEWIKAKPSSELECSICRAPYKVSRQPMTIEDKLKLGRAVLTLVFSLIVTGFIAYMKVRVLKSGPYFDSHGKRTLWRRY